MQAWKAMVQTCNLQVHVSRSLDPFLNLSVEHYLLQNSSPTSTLLFLYVNRPCVVIGKNQNPWLEVDLNSLKQPCPASHTQHVEGKDFKPHGEHVQVVRRRSGGGTVFHDVGNVNYCVICPTANFTRDKHAEMVTAAIRKINTRARVNERHDIVLDQGGILEEEDWPNMTDMHRTIFHQNSKENPSLKVSGSAYKITRQRCLHHGTCLLACSDLPRISRYLRSPSQAFIRAKGVESVRSRIGNVYLDPKESSHEFNASFQTLVAREFQELYKNEKPGTPLGLREGVHDGEIHVSADHEYFSSRIGDDFNQIDEVQAGIRELQSSEWLFGRTPQFVLSSHSNEEDKRARPPLPGYFPSTASVHLKIRGGAIASSRISISSDEDSAKVEREKFDQVLRDRNIHDINDFVDVFNQIELSASTEVSKISRWLNTMFGKTS